MQHRRSFLTIFCCMDRRSMQQHAITRKSFLPCNSIGLYGIDCSIEALNIRMPTMIHTALCGRPTDLFSSYCLTIFRQLCIFGLFIFPISSAIVEA